LYRNEGEKEMLTLKEARKLQKERESKAIVGFVISIALIGLLTYVLLEFTTVFELSTAFYLIPIILFGFSVKKTKIYLFFTAREFTGKVIRLDVYPVKVGTMKGDDSYEYRMSTSEALEVALIIDNGKKTRSLEILVSPVTAKIAEGTTLTLLRFIDTPIITE